jgi:hypothetical protein
MKFIEKGALPIFQERKRTSTLATKIDEIWQRGEAQRRFEVQSEI